MNSNILKQKKYEAVIWISSILRLNISKISYQDFWSKMFGSDISSVHVLQSSSKLLGRLLLLTSFFHFLGIKSNGN